MASDPNVSSHFQFDRKSVLVQNSKFLSLCTPQTSVVSVTVDSRQPSTTDSLAYHSILSVYNLGFNSYSSLRINVPLKMVPVALDLAIIMKSLKVLTKLWRGLRIAAHIVSWVPKPKTPCIEQVFCVCCSGLCVKSSWWLAWASFVDLR